MYNDADFQQLITDLRENNLPNNFFFDLNRLTAEQLDVFIQAFKENKSIKQFIPNIIHDDVADKCAEVIKHNKSLKELNFSITQISQVGTAKIVDALKENKQITCLEIGNNELGPQVGALFADLLEHNHTLTHLKLNYNQLGDEGIHKLAKALKKNKTLKYLDLSGNNITSASLGPLMEALKTNSTLVELNLGANLLGNHCGEKIAEMLFANSSLSSLLLYGNQIKTFDALKILDALKFNTTLTTLSLYGNQITEPVLHLIDTLIAENYAIKNGLQRNKFQSVALCREILEHINNKLSQPLFEKTPTLFSLSISKIPNSITYPPLFEIAGNYTDQAIEKNSTAMDMKKLPTDVTDYMEATEKQKALELYKRFTLFNPYKKILSKAQPYFEEALKTANWEILRK